jgi:hypothetical protein
MKDWKMIDDELANAPGGASMEYYQLCNARTWVSERLEEATREGRMADIARYRLNLSKLDRQISKLLRHAADRLPRSEHMWGDM